MKWVEIMSPKVADTLEFLRKIVEYRQKNKMKFTLFGFKSNF